MGDCRLCAFDVDKEQRQYCNSDERSGEYHPMLKGERLYETYGVRERRQVVENLRETLASMESSLEDLTTEEVELHFDRHVVPSYRRVCEEQVLVFRSVERAMASRMTNGETPSQQDFRTYKATCQEIQKLVKELTEEKS